MLTIVCGEDVAKSRDYFRALIDLAIKKGAGQQRIDKNDLLALANDNVVAATLFEQKNIYVAENLNKQLGRKNAKGEYFVALELIEKSREIELLVWERDVQKRMLKYGGSVATIREFKPSVTVFQLLDMAVPGKLKPFCETLEKIHEAAEDMFAHVMLTRHVRLLVLASLNQLPTNTPPWQIGKIKIQASAWDKHKLIDFYKKLIGIEISLKTGRLTYSVAASIQLVACYYLK